MTRTLRAIAIAALLGATSCGGGSTTTSAPATTSTKKVVGVTLLTQTDAFYKALEAGIRQEAAAKGLDIVLVACEYDPTKQASQIEDFVAQHVAAILAAPCDSNAIVPALAGPEKAGIPVFTADIAAHGGKIESHVASDNVQGGGLAADALAGFMGGKGKIIIIDHPTVASVQERVKGFEDAMKKYPGISIIAKPSADGQRAKAAQVMEDMLQAHRDITGVFGINGPTALAAAGVISTAGRKDIAVVGFDADDEVQAAVKSGGPLKATVVQSPSKIGQTVIDLIADKLSGKAVPSSVAVDVSVVK
ncbi:MAG TPA: substrate-binding domain-containing protein [Vicinamibacterales bacterium]|nr:substrate-binding domain-containing protein [Vicinamibacterales bacterium]